MDLSKINEENYNLELELSQIKEKLALKKIEEDKIICNKYNFIEVEKISNYFRYNYNTEYYKDIKFRYNCKKNNPASYDWGYDEYSYSIIYKNVEVLEIINTQVIIYKPGEWENIFEELRNYAEIYFKQQEEKEILERNNRLKKEIEELKSKL